MFVRVLRPQGFMIDGKHVVVQPGQAQFLPDEAKDAAGFDVLTKSGDLVVVEPEKPIKKKEDSK